MRGEKSPLSPVEDGKQVSRRTLAEGVGHAAERFSTWDRLRSTPKIVWEQGESRGWKIVQRK